MTQIGQIWKLKDPEGFLMDDATRKFLGRLDAIGVDIRAERCSVDLEWEGRPQEVGEGEVCYGMDFGVTYANGKYEGSALAELWNRGER